MCYRSRWRGLDEQAQLADKEARFSRALGRMQQYGQSDNSAEDDPVLSSTDSEDGDDDTYDNDHDDNSNQDSDYIPEKDSPSYTSSAFTTNSVDPTLQTLLNGPQWQLANPWARRAARVDYRLKKPRKLITTGTAKKQKRKFSESAADSSLVLFPLHDPQTSSAEENSAKRLPPSPQTLARWGKRRAEENKSR
ncbi:hypothetical protein COCMIDRAFT_58088, partial [Bipolaris oryzae ATCC 44560]